MFNIGIGELFFIIILVLVVVGPERLPKIMRELGRAIRQLRLVVNELSSQFADELQPIQELQQPLQELQQLANDINPVKQVSRIALDVDARASGQTATRAPRAASPSQLQPPTSGQPPLVKPTAAFKRPAASSSGNPVQIIARTRGQSQSSSAGDDA